MEMSGKAQQLHQIFVERFHDFDSEPQEALIKDIQPLVDQTAFQ
jgi:hypothetical protein